MLSDPYLDEEAQDMVLSLATAVYDDGGKLLGVMGGDVLLKELHELVNHIQVFDKGYGFLLLKSGLVLSSPRPEDILRINMLSDSRIPEDLKSVAQRMIRGETGTQTYTYGGRETKAFFAPTGTGFFLAISFPMSEVWARVNNLTLLLIVIAAMALIDLFKHHLLTYHFELARFLFARTLNFQYHLRVGNAFEQFAYPFARRLRNISRVDAQNPVGITYLCASCIVSMKKIFMN